MSLQLLRRHPRCSCPFHVMVVLLLLLLVAIPTQAFVPPLARPPLPLPSSATPRLAGTFLPPPSPGLHPRWSLIPTTPSRAHSTKRWSQKQQQQQDTPTQPKKQNALEDLERRLKGHDGDEKSPVPFAYVTRTPEGKVSFLFLS